MKIKFTHFGLAILISFSLYSSCSKVSRFSKKPIVENKKIPGQTAPADMVFIPGDGAVPSFYMSVAEEPNINYLIYLKYLETTFGESYPEVYQNALPKQQKLTGLFKFNDPYNMSYLTHPAYNYYPVTGLSWVQIQNYMQWKTDRLNETILIKRGILNFNPEQKDEDSFVTEAYFNGQYQGDVRKNLYDKSTGGERSVSFDDGYLFPGFRLPTEAEWEYAAQQRFQKSIDRKRCLTPFSKDALNHPYGQDYYPLLWGQYYEENSYPLWSEEDEKEAEKFSIDPKRATNYVYIPDENDRNGHPKRLTSIGDFDPKEYGLVNMETNVREWVLDYYEDAFDESTTDLMTIFEKSGFKIKDVAELDENGNHVEKDALGRMKNFRILGIGENGKALEIGNYISENEKNLQRKEILENLKTFRTKRVTEIEKNKASYAQKKERIQQNIELLRFLLRKEKSREEVEKFEKYPDYNTFQSYGGYGTDKTPFWKINLERLEKSIIDYDDLLLKNSLVRIDAELKSIDKWLNENPVPKRLVKGGTWQNPGKHRMGLRETESNVEVGFRCVLPYTGMPAPKVKWKR